MDISTEERNNASWLQVGGRLDASNAGELADRLQALYDDGKRQVVADLGSLEYMSSAGIRVLIQGAKRFAADGGELAISGLHGPVEEVFLISGLESVFRIVDRDDD